MTTRSHPHTASADTRHSWATRMLRARVPIEVVAELLGHSSSQVTEQIYAHLTVEDHREVLVSAGVLRNGSVEA
ncbi:tyrosine-type recombinase/integrase [Streptomyces sp. NPDC051172]|uniref:tyrosine-type recombinase/integrase n=1 Tax=Streptomyces sp. NPDC051172 TaxID=3155796 RepID=UPI00343E5DA1